MQAKKFRSLVRGVKSFCFTITKHGTSVHIKGRGYGHHMGLCQWGAIALSRNGWNFEEILDLYYPNTKAEKVND